MPQANVLYHAYYMACEKKNLVPNLSHFLRYVHFKKSWILAGYFWRKKNALTNFFVRA